MIRAIPYKLCWTIVSSYPSLSARVSVRIRPLTRGPIPGENYFAFHENPFSLTPNPRFLYRTRQAHETLGRLTRGILERKGLILLSGEIGTGKTTLLYSALHLMSVNPAVHNKIGTAMIVHPTLTRDEFLEAVLDEFDVACPSTRRQWRLEALLNMLLEVRRKGGVAVLVIDEAQMLSADLLEEVRSLLSLQTSHEKLLQVVLCGQPELEGKLEGMNLRRGEPLVAVRCNTAPLSLQDAHDYVQHRLRIAGGRSDALFTPEAVNAIHVYTNGIPRLINLLCGQALSVASFYQSERVLPYMVDEAAAIICSGALTPPSDSSFTPSAETLASASLNASSSPSSLPLLGPSVTTLQTLPLLCDPDTLAESVPAALEAPETIEEAEPENKVFAPLDHEPANLEAPPQVEDAELEQAQSSVGSPEPETVEPAGPVQASAAHGISVDASSLGKTPLGARGKGPKEGARSDGASAVQAARKKRRALRHHAKFAQAVKLAHAGRRAVVKCDFGQNPAVPVADWRRPGFRPSPFGRGKGRKSRLGLSDLREFQRISIDRIVGSLRLCNRWLNQWCSEHFTSKSCGKPLFQVGLAGTLFLALAQAIAAGFPRQHLAHVAFGFLGLLFIDISLGLGTYLLLIERRQQTTRVGQRGDAEGAEISLS